MKYLENYMVTHIQKLEYWELNILTLVLMKL